MKDIAPIAYFAFNRPAHALQSLQALKQNTLAEESEIYIFCDGPRHNETQDGLEKINETRAVTQSEQWGKNVHFEFRKKNLGLFQSIPQGITQVVQKHGKVIVVEDDIVVSPGFLSYMNDALKMYENEEEVMHVSGYCPFTELPIPYKESTFFYNHTYCWGWGTWKRAWDHFASDGYALMKKVQAKGIVSYVNLDQTFEFYWGLKYIHERKFQDWNYNWHVSVALRNGLCLQPVKSLTSNIGFDGSGTNCTAVETQGAAKMTGSLPITRIPLKEDRRIRKLLHKRPLKTKTLFLLKHFLRHLVVKKFKTQ